jgi:hypothetical protein
MRAMPMLALLAAGCGLISSDITRLTFLLPTKTYSFDAQTWNLPAGGVPNVGCTTAADCCPPGATDCASLACDGGSCALHQQVIVTQRVNLAQEVPQLASHNYQSLADVFIDNITYMVTSTLNIDLPEITLYLAPDGATQASQGQKFGTVPPTPHMSMHSGDVMLESDAQTTFKTYAQDVTTPFTFIATTTVVVAGGTPVPSGKCDVAVTGKISAQPKL